MSPSSSQEDLAMESSSPIHAASEETGEEDYKILGGLLLFLYSTACLGPMTCIYIASVFKNAKAQAIVTISGIVGGLISLGTHMGLALNLEERDDTYDFFALTIPKDIALTAILLHSGFTALSILICIFLTAKDHIWATILTKGSLMLKGIFEAFLIVYDAEMQLDLFKLIYSLTPFLYLQTIWSTVDKALSLELSESPNNLLNVYPTFGIIVYFIANLAFMFAALDVLITGQMIL
jgi:hypothetical protein